jgi:hypothetical protein
MSGPNGTTRATAGPILRALRRTRQVHPLTLVYDADGPSRFLREAFDEAELETSARAGRSAPIRM